MSGVQTFGPEDAQMSSHDLFRRWRAVRDQVNALADPDGPGSESLHEPSAFTFGTAEEHRAGADALEKMTEVYAKAYARATGHSVQRIAAWMKEETWLTAEEAFELNFCDEIEARQNDMQMVAAFDYGRFRNAPANLVTLARNNGWVTGSPLIKKG